MAVEIGSKVVVFNSARIGEGSVIAGAKSIAGKGGIFKVKFDDGSGELWCPAESIYEIA